VAGQTFGGRVRVHVAGAVIRDQNRDGDVRNLGKNEFRTTAHQGFGRLGCRETRQHPL
jgi:hypothetical protein